MQRRVGHRGCVARAARAVSVPIAVVLLIGAMLLGSAGPAQAQAGAVAPDSLTATVRSADITPIASFQDARALGVDPSGRLYVADAGAQVVVRLAADGTVTDRLGGPGVRSGQFDEPADVDPTNGLTLYVADTGNGRIQVFSRRLKHIESLPAGTGYDALGAGARQPVYDVGRDGPDARATGRPIAVVSTESEAVAAIDADQGVVLRWDAQRRPQAPIGGYEDGAGALAEPVALATLNERLYVADPGQEAIVVFDAFGTFDRRLPLPGVEAVESLSVHRGRLWVVTPRGLHALDPQGRRLRHLRWALEAPLVDAVRREDTLFALTAERLYRVQLPVR